MKSYNQQKKLMIIKEKDIPMEWEITNAIVFPHKSVSENFSILKESGVSYNVKTTKHDASLLSNVFKKENNFTNFYDLVIVTRDGLPFESLEAAQYLMPFSLQEWSAILQVSTRSIDRLKKEKKKLGVSQSEKLIEITLLFDYGVQVFGSKSKFSKWLERNNTGLGGLEPKSLLDTSLGMKAIETALSRIEYGILA